MATPAYTEFEWQAEAAGNGESGEKLTEVFVTLVKQLDGVRTICDLGCGNGHIAGRLAAHGYEVTGIDASRSGLSIAKRAYPNVHFIEGLITDDLAQLQLQTFDLVVSSDVIEHLYRPSDLLEAAFSLLKPQGHLLIGTPYQPDLTGHVLMLEEVGEYTYRIDRSLFHITGATSLRGIAGLRLGRCSAVPENDPVFGRDEADLAEEWCRRHGIAWLGRADIGHDADNKVVPYGKLL